MVHVHFFGFSQIKVRAGYIPLCRLFAALCAALLCTRKYLDCTVSICCLLDMVQTASFWVTSDMARFWPTSLCVPRRADITMRSLPGRRHGGGGPPSWRRWEGKCHDGGPPSRHSGPPSRHSGPPSRHSGQPSRHSGPPSRHSGPPSRHSGPPRASIPPSKRPRTHSSKVHVSQASKLTLALWHHKATTRPKGVWHAKTGHETRAREGKAKHMASLNWLCLNPCIE